MQMTTTNSLESPINLPLTSTDIKFDILHHLFDFDVSPSTIWEDIPVPDPDPYFCYYTEQCSGALHDRGRHVLVRTHQDIIDVAQHLKSSLCRDCIKEKLRSKLTLPRPTNEAEKILDASIDLVARLLLMVEFGHLQYGYRGRRRQVWAVDSLKKWIDSYFGARNLEKESVKLEKTFNAMNLESLAEIEIKWTDNLADHLSLDPDDKNVAIFHHASFLQCQGKSKIFPNKLADETLRTLQLLFPSTDESTKKWFKKHSNLQKLDAGVIRCGALRADDRHIDNFEVWRDRLIILKQLFDEAEPSTVSQWWIDRRNRVQWSTFWVAALVLALTVFFGVVQSIEGALQVYKAYHPWEIVQIAIQIEKSRA